MGSRSFLRLAAVCSLALLGASAQSSGSNGYIGYSLERHGNPNAVVYETADTPSNASAATLPPDVFLNASLHVGEIDIEVLNLTAQINLAAEVLSLLKFNAGVDASIDRVSLLIQNVTAKVLLEARLENLVRMVDDVLSSLDLNPILATLGNDVSSIANATLGGLGGLGGGSSGSGSGTNGSSSGLGARGLDFDLAHNILYSVNDYSGNTHANRVLAQNGDIVEQKLHNDGSIYHRAVIGNYLTDMTFNGYNTSVTAPNGQHQQEQEYVYSPIPGISAVCAIFTDASGAVARTQVISETRAGGGSTIGGELKT